MEVLTVKEVAQYLKASPSWVYGNAGELGASKIGGKLIFTKQGVDYAISRGQEVASNGNGKGQEAHKLTQNQKGRNGLGKRRAQEAEIWRGDESRHGLHYFLQSLSGLCDKENEQEGVRGKSGDLPEDM
jgi:hypothetical protein